MLLCMILFILCQQCHSAYNGKLLAICILYGHVPFLIVSHSMHVNTPAKKKKQNISYVTGYLHKKHYNQHTPCCALHLSLSTRICRNSIPNQNRKRQTIFRGSTQLTVMVLWTYYTTVGKGIVEILTTHTR